MKIFNKLPTEVRYFIKVEKKLPTALTAKMATKLIIHVQNCTEELSVISTLRVALV